MKRSVFILFALILSLQLISAVDVSINENYKSGETIIAKVSGNFITPITKSNVFFYEGHVRVPMDYDVTNIEGDYYIYALTVGKDSGDYSLSIENTQYMKGAEISNEKIVKNFSITDEIADFSLKPGFISTSENFILEIQNLQESQITVSVSTGLNSSGREIFISPDKSTETSFSLKSGEIKKINFELGKGEAGLQYVEFRTDNLVYEAPIYIATSSGVKGETFFLDPDEATYSAPTGSVSKKTIYLYNTGNQDIENISFSVSDSLNPFVSISTPHIENLAARTNFPIELSIASQNEKEIEGYLTAETEEKTTSSYITLHFIKEYVPTENESETSASTKTCAGMNGTLYDTQTQECSVEGIKAKDNWCCLGTVSEIQKESNSTGRIIAIVIIIVIVIVLVLFYKLKYKKAKKPINLIKIAKGKK